MSALVANDIRPLILVKNEKEVVREKDVLKSREKLKRYSQVEFVSILYVVV